MSKSYINLYQKGYIISFTGQVAVMSLFTGSCTPLQAADDLPKQGDSVMFVYDDRIYHGTVTDDTFYPNVRITLEQRPK